MHDYTWIKGEQSVTFSDNCAHNYYPTITVDIPIYLKMT